MGKVRWGLSSTAKLVELAILGYLPHPEKTLGPMGRRIRTGPTGRSKDVHEHGLEHENGSGQRLDGRRIPELPRLWSWLFLPSKPRLWQPFIVGRGQTRGESPHGMEGCLGR